MKLCQRKNATWITNLKGNENLVSGLICRQTESGKTDELEKLDEFKDREGGESNKSQSFSLNLQVYKCNY